MANHTECSGQLKKKMVATGAVLAAGAALLSGGIYAGWTSEATVDQGVGAVDLSAGFIETGESDHLFDEIQDAFPGDYWTRYATLHNAGSIDQVFSVRVDTLTGALTAADDGLKAAVTTCAVAFVDGACEVGDQMLIAPAVLDEDGDVVEPAQYGPNPDDDAVTVVPESFITEAGRDGVSVAVAEGQQVAFKVVYELNEDADQEAFEGAEDTAVVEVKSITAQERVAQDRTDG